MDYSAMKLDIAAGLAKDLREDSYALCETLKNSGAEPMMAYVYKAKAQAYDVMYKHLCLALEEKYEPHTQIADD